MKQSRSSARRPLPLARLWLLGTCCWLIPGLAIAEPPSERRDPSFDVSTTEIPRGIEDLKAIQQRVQELTTQFVNCTVGLKVGPRQGSGVIVSPDGFVLTAAHVIDEAQVPCTVILSDGRRLSGRTLGLDRRNDAGLVKINVRNNESLPYLEMGQSADVQPGQWCLATGHPNGFQPGRDPVLRMGRVLAFQPSTGLTTDCALVGGDSGGPLFALDGTVVGIHSRIGASLAMNIHVPVDVYRDQWGRLKQGEVWGHVPGESPFIGVRGDESDTARIEEVFPDSPAARAGLQVGDIVLRFDGHPIGDFKALQERVAEKRPNELVKVVVRRGEQTRELELIVGNRER